MMVKDGTRDDVNGACLNDLREGLIVVDSQFGEIPCQLRKP